MHRWAIPAAVIVAVEYFVAFLIGERVGFHYSIPFRSFAIIGTAFAVVGSFAAFILRLGWLAYSGERHPTRQLIKDAPKLSGYVAGCMLVTAQLAVLMWLKVMMPLAVPFWADPLFADMDKAIFGVDPWRLAHAFGELPIIDRTYVTWGPVKFLTLIALLCLPESPRKAQALLAYFVIMAAGCLVQYPVSCAGPVFWQQLGLGDRFADLPRQPFVQILSNYLWQSYLASGGKVGGGISAMPSMHVAIAAWVALVVRAYLPRLQFIAWVWVAMIAFGSVYLGWHYAVDSLAAFAITAAGWKAAGSLSALNLTLPAWRLQRA